MQMTLGFFEHSTVGFPKVVLKWTVEDHRVTSAYVTVKGIIVQPWTWYNPHPMPLIQGELDSFDAWVRDRFSEDVTVQG